MSMYGPNVNSPLGYSQNRRGPDFEAKVESKKMRKCREIHSLHFLIFSLFPPSISCIKNCLILSQNVTYDTFVANVTKKIILRAMRKKFWDEFAARKLPKLCRPGVSEQPTNQNTLIGIFVTT